MSPLSDDELHSIAEFLRFYRYTSIYSAVMVTLILIVFVISEILGG